MKNKGIVREINGNFVEIELFKESSCAHCTQCDSKSHKLESFFYDKKDLNVNEFVEFEIDDKSLLKLSFITYISPIIFMFSFYSIASFFNFTEGKKIITTFIGLAFALFILYFLDKKKGKLFISKIKISKETTI